MDSLRIGKHENVVHKHHMEDSDSLVHSSHLEMLVYDMQGDVSLVGAEKHTCEQINDVGWKTLRKEGNEKQTQLNHAKK
jgi:hypothetical protein